MVLIKKKAASGKDQFGASHSATPPLGENTSEHTAGNNHPIVQASLKGYFENLATAATNEKAVLEELMTNFVTLTTTNA